MQGQAFLSPLAGAVLGALYGLFGRWLMSDPFPRDSIEQQTVTAVFFGLSIAYLFGVPFGLGLLSAALSPREGRFRWLYWLGMPLVSVTLLLAAVLALAWEGIICIVMASPVLFSMAVLGGFAVGATVSLSRRPVPHRAVASCLVLPFVFGPIEPYLPIATEERTVSTVVDIAAPPETVWRNVVRVPHIGPQEQTFGFFQRIGIPQPLEATLDREGVGGVREARFAGGLRFHERVTEWEPARQLGFTIAVDLASLRPDLLDPHVTVGGPHFDVVFGRFVLEPRAGGTRLTLLSHHRVTTRFNAYTAFWTEAVMQDIQQNICRVIRGRAEREPGQPLK